MTDVAKLLCEISIPRSTPSQIAAHIRRCKVTKQINPIKSFFQTGESPKVLHFVIPVQSGIKLAQQPSQLLPEIWRVYLASNVDFKVSPNTYSKLIKTDFNMVPDLLKKFLTFKNGKWYSLNHNELSNSKSTITSTFVMADNKHQQNSWDCHSLKDQKQIALEEPSTSRKVVSFLIPPVPGQVTKKSSKKCIISNHCDKKHLRLKRKFLKKPKKKKIIIDESSPPKVKFILKFGNQHSSEMKTIVKAGNNGKAPVHEESSTYLLPQSLESDKNKSELKGQLHCTKNCVLQKFVNNTKDLAPKSNEKLKNDDLSYNGKVNRKTLSISKSELEARNFLSNLNLVSKDLVEPNKKSAVALKTVTLPDTTNKCFPTIKKPIFNNSLKSNKINGIIPESENKSANSISSESRTRLKKPSREVTHRRRPPSTAKLKETLDLTCKFSLNKPKTKIPTSCRCPKN